MSAPARRGSWAFIVGGILACAASLAFLRVETEVAIALGSMGWRHRDVSGLTFLGIWLGAALGLLTLARHRRPALLSIGVQLALFVVTLVCARYMETRYPTGATLGISLTVTNAPAHLLLSAAATVFTGLALFLTRGHRGPADRAPADGPPSDR